LWLRILGWTVLSLLTASAGGYVYLARWSGDGETPPRGFSSRNELIGYSADDMTLEGAGGHAEASSEVAAVVDIYGLFDFETPEGKSAGVVKDFLGKQSYEEAPELWKRLSPATYLNAGDPPTLIIHGSLDEIVPISQAEMLSRRLRELKIPSRYLRLEGWPHTMDAAVPVNIYCRYQILKFLREQVGE
jgi:fermentation-respiration switch protein FrsA (DUF1100 family)